MILRNEQRRRMWQYVGQVATDHHNCGRWDGIENHRNLNTCFWNCFIFPLSTFQIVPHYAYNEKMADSMCFNAQRFAWKNNPILVNANNKPLLKKSQTVVWNTKQFLSWRYRVVRFVILIEYGLRLFLTQCLLDRPLFVLLLPTVLPLKRSSRMTVYYNIDQTIR